MSIMDGVWFFVGKAIAEVLVALSVLGLFVLVIMFFVFVEYYQQSKKKKRK